MKKLDLPAGEMHVWWSPSAEAPAGAVAALTPEERERRARFHFESDRESYLAAHAMLRLLLATYGSSASTQRFAETERGKPFVDGGPEINLSHTRGLVACAFSRSFAVGVDVEPVERTNDWRRLMSRVLCAAEIADILGRSAPRQQHRFYEFWTAKEAWSKALGLGLHADFRAMNALDPSTEIFLSRLEVVPEFCLAAAADAHPSKVVVERFDWKSMA